MHHIISESTAHMIIRQRAVGEMAAGLGVVISGRGFLFPAEFVDEQHWSAMRQENPLLIISAQRAAILGIATTQDAVAFDACSCSKDDLWNLMVGRENNLKPLQAPLPEDSSAMLAMLKQAGVIPAALWFPNLPESSHLLTIDPVILHASDEMELIRGETVSLPLKGAEGAKLTSFRMRYGSGVHLALVVGEQKPDEAPLVRVHSSCVTGDLLGSLRCDCGDQLQGALSAIKNAGHGVLLYLNQEGRGLGITNKLRAYQLQEQGMDTYAANHHLGFMDDERDYAVASAMLRGLGVKRIKLLTNNQDKIDALQPLGIEVVERVALMGGRQPHNEAYLDAKARKSHLF